MPGGPLYLRVRAMSPELVQTGVRRGAADCISKDRLSHLPQAVARSLERLDPAPAPVREPRSPAGDLWLDLFQDNTSTMLVILSVDGTVLEFNRGAKDSRLAATRGLGPGPRGIAGGGGQAGLGPGQGSPVGGR